MKEQYARPYTVTDEQSNLTDCLLPQLGLAAMREINLYLNANISLPVSRTQCAQPSEGQIEEGLFSLCNQS